MATDQSTRERILGLVASSGPITAATLAKELGVTSAGIRRHLTLLTDDDYIVEHEQTGSHERVRGRPARSYVATAGGQRALQTAYSDVAVDALKYLRDSDSLDAFVQAQAAAFEASLEGVVDLSTPIEERVRDLAAALGDQGYATSVRPGPGGYAVQLCQGHCPVQRVAEAVPEWCEAETQAISRVLDVHVQRLSTLAGGAHVCTTNIPLTPVGSPEGN